MGSLYSEHRTWLHAVSAGWKLACMFALSTGVFLMTDLRVLALVCGLCIVLFATLGRAIASGRRLLVSLGVAALLVLGFHTAMQQPLVGWVSTLRMVSATLLGIALTITTRSADLLDVLEWLLRPLQALGVRTPAIALQLAIMLRFVEHFFVIWKRLDDAHRLRTGKAGGLRLLAPLTLHMLKAAQRVADTLQLRLRN
jgi:biotin transport system permease protein